MSNWTSENRKKIKYVMGGKCSVCAYDKSSWALQVHHLIPENKLSDFSSRFRNTSNAEAIRQELETCCLLCANCHAELHENILSARLTSSFDSSRWDEFCKTCTKCGYKVDNPFYQKCKCVNSKSITGVNNKVNWDKIDILLLLHRHDGEFTSAGRELGITGNAVKKIFISRTGFLSYKDYVKETPIFSFDGEEVNINYLLKEIK